MLPLDLVIHREPPSPARDLLLDRNVRVASVPVTAQCAAESPRAAGPTADRSAADETVLVGFSLGTWVRLASAPPLTGKVWCWSCSMPSAFGAALNASSILSSRNASTPT